MSNSTGLLSPQQNATRLRAIRDRVRRQGSTYGKELSNDCLRALAYIDRLASKDLGEEDWSE